MKRECVRCKVMKDESEFTPSQLARELTGRQSYCRPCRSIDALRWQAKNTSWTKAYHKKRHASNMADPAKRAARNLRMVEWGRSLRRRALAALGTACFCCGEAQEQFLDIDHMNNDGKLHRRIPGYNAYDFYRRIAAGETSGLQILCSNCNNGKRRNRGVCPHEAQRRQDALYIVG